MTRSPTIIILLILLPHPARGQGAGDRGLPAEPELLLPLLASSTTTSTRPHLTLASKTFTESVILAELATHLARSAGADATHKSQLGGTRLVFNALARGEIDIYPEYTGTLIQEILANQRIASPRDLERALAAQGIAITAPLGFNNTYAVGMLQPHAQSLNLNTISDLKNHPELKLAFSNEFIDRKDGWPALRDAYALPHKDVRGLDHDLAYRALTAGSIDATDLYSTDAEIAYYSLKVLADDRRHFPEYQAVYLYRADLTQRAPAVVAAIQKLTDNISDRDMIAMNAKAKLHKIPETQVAADFLSQSLNIKST